VIDSCLILWVKPSLLPFFRKGGSNPSRCCLGCFVGGSRVSKFFSSGRHKGPHLVFSFLHKEQVKPQGEIQRGVGQGRVTGARHRHQHTAPKEREHAKRQHCLCSSSGLGRARWLNTTPFLCFQKCSKQMRRNIRPKVAGSTGGGDNSQPRRCCTPQ
jgi:hypothetical protein